MKTNGKARLGSISLLITSYNQRPWLERALQAAVAQRVDVLFEIIVCDDGSTDGTLNSLMRIAAEHAVDCRFVWQPNQGFRAARSRNNGIRLAAGELLVFIDGDTIPAPWFLDDHIRIHAEERVLGCGSRKNVVVDSPAAVAAAHLSTLLPGDEPPDREAEQQRQWLGTPSAWMACLSANFSVPRADCVFFDERFTSWGSEDRDLSFRLVSHGLLRRMFDRPNAVHLKLHGTGFGAMKHDAIVSLLDNKLVLRSLYPAGEMAPALRLVRFCHLDPDTGRWSLGPLRSDVSADDVLEEFSQWSRKVRRPLTNG